MARKPRKHLRHKTVLAHSIDTRCPKKGGKMMKLTGGFGGDFNMDLDVPIGTPDPAGDGFTLAPNTPQTATGPISQSADVTFEAWYTDSDGNTTALSVAGISVTGTPLKWSLTFTSPNVATADFTFYIQGTYQPATARGFTQITLSTGFSTT
jgi:hypothetical protein